MAKRKREPDEGASLDTPDIKAFYVHGKVHTELKARAATARQSLFKYVDEILQRYIRGTSK